MIPRALTLVVASVWLAGSVAAQSADPVPLAARSKGSPQAPVTVYEMSDFQCPYCRRFALETFPLLDSLYVATGKVRWIFINFPLTSIHPNSVPAAGIALCAAKQGAFWRVHDLLYQHQSDWAELKEPADYLLGLADSARISKATLTECVKSSTTNDEVRADAEGANELVRRARRLSISRAGSSWARSRQPCFATFSIPSTSRRRARRASSHRRKRKGPLSRPPQVRSVARVYCCS